MAEEIYVQSGNRIRTLRRALGYSELKLAEKAHITRKFLHEIEMGKSGFSAETLVRIADALECDCGYIVKGTSKSNMEEMLNEIEEQMDKNYGALKSEIKVLRNMLSTM